MRNRDMILIADVIGSDAAMKLQSELGGMYVYIPKPDPADIELLLEEYDYDAKAVALKARVSLSKVHKVMKQVKDRKKAEAFEVLQIPLFPENN